MATQTNTTHLKTPLQNLEEWEDFLKERYPEVPEKTGAFNPGKKKEEFRNYEATARPTVREFYRLNHRYQTFDFVQSKKREFLSLDRRKMGIWEAMEFLNTLVDDSDPDTDLSQLEHLLQTAEQIRRDGHPRWFILTGLIHDLGKILCLFGEPQWAVVGDTFPVGCAWSGRRDRPGPAGRNKSFSTSFSPTTRTAGSRSIKPGSAFTKQAAVWARFRSPGATTNICTTS